MPGFDTDIRATEIWAVIPATGTGQRMQADRPKQYLKVASKTIVEMTLDNLLSYPDINGIVLILHPQDRYWESLEYRHEKAILLSTGGKLRHHSVFNGLSTLRQKVEGDPIVLIHDAVRPFVLHHDLSRLIEVVKNNKEGALLAAPVADTLKFSDDHQAVLHTHPRADLWRAFTPQAFRLSIILQALDYVIKKDLVVTDDASAMELLGYHPKLVEGDRLNIKITHPEDLIIALFLQDRSYSISQ